MHFLIFVILLTLNAHAQNAEVFTRDIITDPNLSARCKDLLQERNDKIKIRQTLTSYYQRNQNLLKKTPPTRPLLTKRVEATGITLRNELYIASLQVQNLEESIIRSGCPGINL